MESYHDCHQYHYQVCTLQFPFHLQWHALRDSASADGSTRVPLLADSPPSMRAVRSQPYCPPLAGMLERATHSGDINAPMRVHAHWSVPISVFVSACSWADFL